MVDRNLVHCSCGLKADRQMVYEAMVAKDTKYRDKYDQPIWFPKDERPYFDRALQKTFHSKKEKHEYMKEKNLAMDGSDTKIISDVAQGDVRSKSFRKDNKMED